MEGDGRESSKRRVCFWCIINTTTVVVSRLLRLTFFLLDTDEGHVESIDNRVLGDTRVGVNSILHLHPGHVLSSGMNGEFGE